MKMKKKIVQIQNSDRKLIKHQKNRVYKINQTKVAQKYQKYQEFLQINLIFI